MRNAHVTAGLLALCAGCAQGVVSDPTGPPPAMVDESARLLSRTRSTTDVQLFDVDGDGDGDLLWASQPGEEGSGLEGSVDLTINEGGDVLTDGRGRIPSDLGAWTFALAVDVDLDGDFDVALSRPARTSAQVAILLNDGEGRFERSAGVPELPGETTGLVFSRLEQADVDGDGDPDLVVPVFSDLAIERDAPNVLLLNDGAGRFAEAPEGSLPVVGSYQDFTLSILARDFTGDGRVDLFVGEAERRSRLWVGDGAGRFVDETEDDGTGRPRMPEAQLRCYAMAAGDVDLDGDDDVIVVNDVIETDAETQLLGTFLFVNDGAGRFELRTVPSTDGPRDTRALSLADVDADGVPDLVLGNNNLTVDHGGLAIEILVGSGDGAFLPVMDVPRIDAAVFAVAVGDLDGNGLPDVAAAVAGSTRGDAERNILLGNVER